MGPNNANVRKHEDTPQDDEVVVPSYFRAAASGTALQFNQDAQGGCYNHEGGDNSGRNYERISDRS
jgi:hypothetical protein